MTDVALPDSAITAPSAEFWRERSVLITGVCGTVGRELLRQLLALPLRRITGLDNNESELFFLKERYREEDRFGVYHCDIADDKALSFRCRGADLILHTAALKHVGVCERSPRSAVNTNILGTQNVIEAAIANRVGRTVFTSSDKAVNPTSVMGTSKLMCERLLSAAALHDGAGGCEFVSVRFGNIIGSRGSVVPLFRRQIEAGGPVTLTSAAMTRFMMSLEEAARLVLFGVETAETGEVFVTKMPVMRIRDLAEVMIEELAPQAGRRPDSIAIREVGPRIGEKMFEELLNEEEIRRAFEFPSHFTVVPATLDPRPRSGGRPVDRPYRSDAEPCLDKDALRRYLQRHRALEREV